MATVTFKMFSTPHRIQPELLSTNMVKPGSLMYMATYSAKMETTGFIRKDRRSALVLELHRVYGHSTPMDKQRK